MKESHLIVGVLFGVNDSITALLSHCLWASMNLSVPLLWLSRFQCSSASSTSTTMSQSLFSRCTLFPGTQKTQSIGQRGANPSYQQRASHVAEFPHRHRSYLTTTTTTCRADISKAPNNSKDQQSAVALRSLSQRNHPLPRPPRPRGPATNIHQCRAHRNVTALYGRLGR